MTDTNWHAIIVSKQSAYRHSFCFISCFLLLLSTCLLAIILILVLLLRGLPTILHVVLATCQFNFHFNKCCKSYDLVSSLIHSWKHTHTDTITTTSQTCLTTEHIMWRQQLQWPCCCWQKCPNQPSKLQPYSQQRREHFDNWNSFLLITYSSYVLLKMVKLFVPSCT